MTYLARVSLILGALLSVFFQSSQIADPAAGSLPATIRYAFLGLHGGVFEALGRFAGPLGVQLDYIADNEVGDKDLSVYTVIFFQHLQADQKDSYFKSFAAAKKKNPSLHLVGVTKRALRLFHGTSLDAIMEHDPRITEYYLASSSENLRRFLIYALVKFAGRRLEVLPPEKVVRFGLYHPDHGGLFSGVADFRRWANKRAKTPKQRPCVAIAVHTIHLDFQQPGVVDMLIRGLEEAGVTAVGVIDTGEGMDVFTKLYQEALLELRPDAVIHTCHSRERPSFRKQLAVPHLHSIFFKRDSIGRWKSGVQGIAPNEIAFHVTSQEILGAIEPQIGAGTVLGGGSSEEFTPIAERIQHLVARTVAWTRLRTTENATKKVAFVYYDREMGKAELMRGSATGMFMNGPRSLVEVLERMKEKGYAITRVPSNDEELLSWMMDRGRQIGVWNPRVLDRLAKSGNAVLIPVETYRTWLDKKVPALKRKEIIQAWGEPPGRFLVWRNNGKEFIVIPRIDLGNVILLPQPLRGEAHDSSRVHDKLTPPPHNYLATYFWLQENFRANALIHFGTHGTEFLLPGRAVGLGPDDWSDILMGDLPNINPWILNNLGESASAKRRSYAVLIDHLTPPLVNAALSDELLNLHDDIDKWDRLEAGILKEKFSSSITQQVRKANLGKDVHIEISGSRLLLPEEILQISEYLHDVGNEATTVSLHVFGQPPRQDLLIPYLVTCLGQRFLDALEPAVGVPMNERRSRGERDTYLRKIAEHAVDLVVRSGLTPAKVLQTLGNTTGGGGLSKELESGFELALRLHEAFGQTHDELDNLFLALDGRFVAPGPANSPDRNPSSIPSGRNMYLLNPKEIPSRPSWEMGCQLVDQLLEVQSKAKGRFPEKVGFTLSSFATFQDYGVMEAQILYLLGVRPVWDARNLVTDIELIPTNELGRPRIDVFIAAGSYYRDTLPTRMRLIDKAIRLVAGLEEEENYVYEHSARVRSELEGLGIPAERSTRLSRARIFGKPPGQLGSAAYYYLVERSGDWEKREDLAQIYMEHSRYVYTEGIWGKDAPEAYERNIRDTELILRSWSDRTRSPLSDKYKWYQGGSLSLAVKHLTGREPEFFLSDIRDPDRATMVRAEDALRKDFRVRLFNRKWIEGMMNEGYAGADQIAVHVKNTMGWKIMRENSVTDDVWEQIVDIFLRDKKELDIRNWFEANNAFAFQEITEILLETIRKGYWKPDDSTVLEIAEAYATSVSLNGEGGGLMGGSNVKLASFVTDQLRAPGETRLNTLLASYSARMAESSSNVRDTRPNALQVKDEIEEVWGQELSPVLDLQGADTLPPHPWLGLVAEGMALLLVVAGFVLKRGHPHL